MVSNFLIRFFRNLLLGEGNELKNRYMVVNVPELLDVEDKPDPTSPRQVPGKSPTSS